MKEIKLFINGEFKTSSETFTSINPANGEAVAKVYLPSNNDIEAAVTAADNAFYSSEWKSMDQNKRAEILLTISEKIKARKDELIDLEVKDSGSTLKKAKADIHNAASFFKVMAGVAKNFQFEELDEKASVAGFSKNFRVYEPIGVCAQIIPWNFPLVMAAWKIGPIIATGCTSVLKSAQETPVTAGILAEILNESGLPKGVVNIITGGAEVGQMLVNHPKVKKVAFTGSTNVGKQIMAQAAKQMKKVSLELGGKSANIILNDADLSIAVDGALYAFLYHSGQACDSGTRLFVQDGIYNEFMTNFVKRLSDVKVNNTQDPAAGYGPVVNEKQFNTIMNYINTTKKEGGKLLFGGEREMSSEMSKGFYIKPTAFEITPDNTIFNEEIFGPVVGITKFKTEDEAIKLANQSHFGLAGAVWSKDEAKAMKVAKSLEAGTVWINEYHLLNPGMPFGGYKESGFGREMGKEGIMSYLEVKHLWISECNERAKKPWYDVLF
ncbi:MAG: aldehyde dehydrogenase family protein [Bacteriovoracaceae bacterium]